MMQSSIYKTEQREAENKWWAVCVVEVVTSPTLCDPIDGSPPGSPVPGILQTRTLKWVAISFSNAGKWKVKVKLARSYPTRSNPMDWSPPGSFVHGIFQARVLEWGAIAFSKHYAISTQMRKWKKSTESESSWFFLSGIQGVSLVISPFSSEEQQQIVRQQTMRHTNGKRK